jgi:NAD(P)-dependent dehydrogenase (short-subunit alcohol dehydrogenase family)
MIRTAAMANEMEITSKLMLAIVTGASRGLDRSTALHLAKKGADIIVTHRSNLSKSGAAVAVLEAEGRKAIALQLDAGNVQTFNGFVGHVREVLAKTFDRDQMESNFMTGDEQIQWSDRNQRSLILSGPCCSASRINATSKAPCHYFGLRPSLLLNP